ncbi:rod shape-determining protein MreD [Phocaeicola coprophilus]|uniref:rod shape-determining protein MreD n=1 Tax=Phocaeicola coprophilus TaxID=387090 RepID=UPI0035208326
MARILWFAGLILLQVLVLNYVHIHQCAKPLLYVYFILKLDSNTGRNQTMLWSFALGLCIDILSNTPGLNATASVLLAFFRQPLLQAQTTRDATGDFEPGIRTMGFSPFLRYLLVAVLLHATVLNLTDYFSFHRIGMILLKSISDTLATIVCILCIEAIRRKH